MKSHPQFIISIALALALGASLSTHPAIGYPAGAAVSLGANPVGSGGGTVSSGSTDTLITPVGDQDFIVTDLILTGRSNDSDCRASLQFNLILGSGAEMGDFNIGINNRNEHPRMALSISANYGTGIRIPSGDSLTATVTPNTTHYCESSGLQISYAFSGYYAQT